MEGSGSAAILGSEHAIVSSVIAGSYKAKIRAALRTG